MGDEPVEAIRQSQRYEIKLNRRKLKNEESDLRRSIADVRLTDVDLPALANKLKNKADVNVTDLRILKNVLIENVKNIELVLTTEGALRGLAREISGLDVNRQVEAAGCLCNLALADQRGCLAIIRVAGAYIVAALDSQNIELAITCAWTLGNLSGSGLQAGRQVAAAGAVARLCAMLRGQDEARMHAALSALTLLAHAMGEQLSKEHVELIVASACKRERFCAFRLAYILSSHPHFSDSPALGQRLQARLCTHLPALIHHHITSCLSPTCCDLLHAVRALANMEHGPALANMEHGPALANMEHGPALANMEHGPALANMEHGPALANMEHGPARSHLLAFLQREPDLRALFFSLLKDPRLNVSMLWLIGNLRSRHEHDFSLKHLHQHQLRAPRDGPGPEAEGFDVFAAEPDIAPMLDE